MSTLGIVIVLTGVGVVGVLIAVSGWVQPVPSLARVIADLQRPATGRGGTHPAHAGESALASRASEALRAHPSLMPSDAELRLAGVTPERYVARLALAAVIGMLAPALVLTILQTAGIVGLSWFVPLIASIGCAVLGPVLVHTAVVERAAAVRSDLRYQVSAYLDVVTMLLAGNAGYEGALQQAAQAGDGRLFAELRRRMRESGARGSSLTDALRRTGEDLGIEELEQVSATAALSAAEGAPVARTLASKCATLRTALATEQESEARLRTSRLTTPIVGMALIFMGLVIYPALSFS